MEGYEDLIAAFSASCRVDANQARGSCTIIHSKDGHTYALTNFVRNRFNTIPKTNSVGSSVFNLDNVGNFTYLKSKIGSLMNLKK